MNNELIPKFRFKHFHSQWKHSNINDLSYINPESFIPDKFYYIDLNSISNNTLNSNPKLISKNNAPSRAQRLAKKYDLFFQSVRPYQKNNYFFQLNSTKYNYVFSSGYMQLRPKRNISNYFLFYGLRTDRFVFNVLSNCTGGSYPAINSTNFKSLNIYYPNSLNEQQQIGTFFAKLDRMTELQTQKISHLKNLKKGYLQKMFPQKGENVPRLRFNGFYDEWDEKKLEQIVNIFDNKRIAVTSTKRQRGSIGYYGANGIMDYINGFTHIGHYVLLAEDGANNVRNYPIHNVNGKIWVNNHAHVIQGKLNICDTDFLAYLLKEIDLYPYLVGNGRYKLNSNVMKGIVLNLPSIQEQNQIGQFFKHLDQYITKQKNKLTQLKQLKKGYLQKMFI